MRVAMPYDLDTLIRDLPALTQRYDRLQWYANYFSVAFRSISTDFRSVTLPDRAIAPWEGLRCDLVSSPSEFLIPKKYRKLTILR
jgi:hypothetical protein